MKLYKLERIGHTDWDEYSGFVIAANHHTIARKLAQDMTSDLDCDWTSPEISTCTLIAKESVFKEQQIVLSDFRAG